MTAEYINRYGDTIHFEELDKTKILMSGYDDHYRVSYDYDYSSAYEHYVNECNAMEEPDMCLLYEDVAQSKLRNLTYQEFAHTVRDVLYNQASVFYKYTGFIEVDKNRLFMFDPSGGPYIQLGTDVGLYFDDGKIRIVDEIAIHGTYAILTISHERVKPKRG